MTPTADHAPNVPLEYRGAREAAGPLLVVGGVEGIGFDALATVRLASGEVRRGLVLEVHRDLAGLDRMMSVETAEVADA